MVKLVGLALVTLQVSVVELPSCTTGRDAVSSISGITGVGKSIFMQLTSSVTIATRYLLREFTGLDVKCNFWQLYTHMLPILVTAGFPPDTTIYKQVVRPHWEAWVVGLDIVLNECSCLSKHTWKKLPTTLILLEDLYEVLSTIVLRLRFT